MKTTFRNTAPLVAILAILFTSISIQTRSVDAQQKKKPATPAPVAEAPPAAPLKLSYELAMPKPYTHLYEVSFTVGNVSAPALDFQIPSWTPGSYLMREFAKNVQDFSVRDTSGNKLPWEKTDKGTWHVTTNGAKEVKVFYRVYANELSVRTSHMDSTHAYLNGASVFMYVKGGVNLPLTVHVNAPNGWKVTSPLALEPDANGNFSAPNYDILVDSPMEIGTHHLIEFDVLGKKHRVAIWGEGNYDDNRLKADITKIVEQGAAIFGGLPYDHYTFFIHLQPNIGGGLEHLNSTTCQGSPNGFKPDARYQGFLGLLSHEYFHLWNVKRIRPKALGPFDYQNENYTHNLWLSEGFTDYYSSQLLLRAGLINQQNYLGTLASEIMRYERAPSRLVDSAESSSFDAWIKYYRPDDNSVNTMMSYYDKGAMLGMLFDLEIRKRTGDAKNLDDVMRLLYENHALPKPGFTDAELKAAFEKIAGGDLTEFFAKYVKGTAELPFDEFLASAGLRLTRGYGGIPVAGGGRGGRGGGGQMEGSENANPGYLGMTVRPGTMGLFVVNVPVGTPAYDGGINSNDEVIAVNGAHITTANMGELISSLQPGSTAVVSFFRREKLQSLNVTVGKQPPDRYSINIQREADAAANAIRKGWLSEK